jgi:hypothetical protein
MIPKSGTRFSEKIMRPTNGHDPEKWDPVFGKDHAPMNRHDPEKWDPVFGKDHAPMNRRDPEKWTRFSEKIMRQQDTQTQLTASVAVQKSESFLPQACHADF